MCNFSDSSTSLNLVKDFQQQTNSLFVTCSRNNRLQNLDEKDDNNVMKTILILHNNKTIFLFVCYY